MLNTLVVEARWNTGKRWGRRGFFWYLSPIEKWSYLVRIETYCCIFASIINKATSISTIFMKIFNIVFFIIFISILLSLHRSKEKFKFSHLTILFRFLSSLAINHFWTVNLLTIIYFITKYRTSYNIIIKPNIIYRVSQLKVYF